MTPAQANKPKKLGRPCKPTPPAPADDDRLTFPLAVRLMSECTRLGVRPADFVPAFAPGSRLRKKLTPDFIPDGPALRDLAVAGADISYILAGRRRSSVRATGDLQALFGGNTEHLPPAGLLGALLCLQHDGAAYLEEANPFPPRSHHHADVRIGWELAHRASDADTAQAGAA